jgi:hypothetical protein
MAKNPCPISRTQFKEKAKSLPIPLGNATLSAEPREFSTGSFGWYVNGKTVIEIDGKQVPVQVGMNLIVVGSKEAKDD